MISDNQKPISSGFNSKSETSDILSDVNLEFSNQLSLPTFKIRKQAYIKRLTLIIENSIIKKFFYPVFPPNKHIEEVIKWLTKN